MKKLKHYGGTSLKKVVITILAMIILSILIFFLLFSSNKATTLKEDLKGEIDISKLNKIEIIRSFDDKTIILKGSQSHQLINELLNAKLIEAKVEEESTESYWINIKEDGNRFVGIRMSNSLTFSLYDYKDHNNYSNNYTLVDDSVLRSVERLFE